MNCLLSVVIMLLTLPGSNCSCMYMYMVIGPPTTTVVGFYLSLACLLCHALFFVFYLFIDVWERFVRPIDCLESVSACSSYCRNAYEKSTLLHAAAERKLLIVNY